MKRFHIKLLLLLLILTIVSCAKTSARIDALSASADYDIIVFGEEHDNAAHHEAELSLLKTLSTHKIAFAMEMFERDVQPVLDSFMHDLITEEDFLGSSRPWPNYSDDYRDMLLYAKENGIDVIAANIPRFMAADVARTGSVQTPDSAMFDVPSADSSSYREKFLETLSGMQGPMGMLNPDKMYEAQLYKDATMAMSIIRYLDSHPGYKVFFICGRFHSDEGLGTVYQIKQNSAYRVLNAEYSDKEGGKHLIFKEY